MEKTFTIHVSIDSGKQHTTFSYEVPYLIMLQMEGAFTRFLADLNGSPPTLVSSPDSPRLRRLVILAAIHESSKNHKPHGHGKPFADASMSWHDLPSEVYPELEQRCRTALSPFAAYQMSRAL
jgi:hypothetical protein